MSHEEPRIRFDERGLVPVVAQEVGDSRVLMVAWANQEAVERTLSTGFAHYYSRSRQQLWKKGDTSGHLQRVTEVRVDCDQDTLLYLVSSAGPACHTGEATCFFRAVGDDGLKELGPQAGTAILSELHRVVQERRRAGGEGSYVSRLLTQGAGAIAGKVVEEAGEVAQALQVPEDDAALVHEVADLWFHTVVALGSRGLGPDQVLGELHRRFGISGIEEKARRNPKS